MRPQNNYQSTKKVDPYLVQKIMSASPEQLIAYLYDAGATACLKNDRIKAGIAVRELISALNFDFKETAVIFFNVYRYLNHIISKGKLEEARNIFIDLKKTWAQAHKVV